MTTPTIEQQLETRMEYMWIEPVFKSLIQSLIREVRQLREQLAVLQERK